MNEGLEDAPELVNEDPYDGGWLVRLRLGDEGPRDGLMTAADYEAQLAG